VWVQGRTRRYAQLGLSARLGASVVVRTNLFDEEHPPTDGCTRVAMPPPRVVAHASPRWLEPSIEELIEWAAASSAPYKRLAEVRFVAVIPKSSSGKILRRLLRDQLNSEQQQQQQQR
jgi:acyl-CoA synthetase (AMP-forming)/AMP-acid ligase II